MGDIECFGGSNVLEGHVVWRDIECFGGGMLLGEGTGRDIERYVILEEACLLPTKWALFGIQAM